MPNRRALEKGLRDLIEDTSLSISFNSDHPLSEDDILMATTNLASYLAHYIVRNMRRAKSPLSHADLTFKVVRTRNSQEEVLEDRRRCIFKGEKEWYYMALIEFEHGNGLPQILAEGDLRKDKAELFDSFVEMVERRNGEWDKEDERRQKSEEIYEKSREEENQKSREEENKKSREEEIALREIAKIEAATKRHISKGKGKGAAVKSRSSGRQKKVKSADLVDEEDLADE